MTADGYITFDEIRALGDKARANGFTGQIFDLGWMRAQMLGSSGPRTSG